MSSKFSIWMRRHLINRCIELTYSTEGLSKHHHSRLNSEADYIMGCEVSLDCDSPIKGMVASLEKQEIAAVWRRRRECSLKLALKMRLLSSVYRPTSMAGKNFFVHAYSVTRLGCVYYKAPVFFSVFVGWRLFGCLSHFRCCHAV